MDLFFRISILLTAICLVSCSSAESRKRDAEEAAQIAEHKKLQGFVRDLCQESCASKNSAETPEVKLCTRDVKRSFQQYSLRKRYEIAVFICESSSTAETWRQQTIPRLNCYQRAIQLLKEPALADDSRKCQGSASSLPMVNRGRGDCYRNALNDFMSQE